jgi:hypothetical protein
LHGIVPVHWLARTIAGDRFKCFEKVEAILAAVARRLVGDRRDYPTGKSRRPPICGVSSPFCKNISVFQKYKSGYMIRHPAPLRGAFRERHERGAGCGGRGWCN